MSKKSGKNFEKTFDNGNFFTLLKPTTVADKSCRSTNDAKTVNHVLRTIPD